MQIQQQHGRSGVSLPNADPSGRPVWLRLLAALCLMLVVVLSTAQVCHTHTQTAVKQRSSQNDSSPEDHCPLCVAMHSALPTDIHVAPEVLTSVGTLDSVAADAERMFRWRFEMASRPPPAC